ncbi:hypothetical protein F751_3151 [Auxenochlorella protothecoides]|uniref:Uncharacterized protein n=1 Tax=Auxenochlorella protothecoides TaxID=3075 RepID=A0A087SFC9_AUXPR|nr:hypothetical protein F751_3151 [Auxenochlorella protothecoides]KFM24433.1 hypothetical protein F751_3151 [Auxenochlorella protothecoides]
MSHRECFRGSSSVHMLPCSPQRCRDVSWEQKFARGSSTVSTSSPAATRPHSGEMCCGARRLVPGTRASPG